MGFKFNPFTGTFDISEGGEVQVVDDANGVVMLENAIIDGELIIEDEGLAIIKNSLASAFQKIVDQITIAGNGEVRVDSLANLEVNNG